MNALLFIDESAIADTARKYLPIAEQDAQAALQAGDRDTYLRRLNDAAWYASLLAQYDPTFWQGVAA